MDEYSIYRDWREMIRKQIAKTDDMALIAEWKSIRSAINVDDMKLALKRVAHSSLEVKKAVKQWQNEDRSSEIEWGKPS